ncbi:MAG: glucose-1-phosphate adenylyltransferase [Oscillospiraceae bacterium]|nr:glucose-1-phosphate adenylyltransferase [Oscillospiraceae bacterium]
MKKETIALLLAGGQGNRLGILTKKVAKPAVFYGAKYRIIDFALSNCANSGVGTVGVLTQYRPLKLNSHIGIGKPWDMDRFNGGVTILSPYSKGEVGEWYKGSAGAVYQNIHYVDEMDPKYVLVLSTDHVYKMDYREMLGFHKANKAEVTISVIDVPLEEASRLGIMSAEPSGRITEFEEKPKAPKSTLASMGIYVFNWDVLRRYLIADNDDPASSKDFGKNIITSMLRDRIGMWAYRFEGYWKDVGTIQAYWEANMDLLERVPRLNLFDRNSRIYTPNPVMPAHFIGGTGDVRRSVLAEGCMVYGKVYNSIVSTGAYIGEGAEVIDSVVMPGVRIGKGSTVAKTILCENARVGDRCVIGVGAMAENAYMPEIYCTDIDVIGEDATVPDGTMIGKNVAVDNGVKASDFKGVTVASGSYVAASA